MSFVKNMKKDFPLTQSQRKSLGTLISFRHQFTKKLSWKTAKRLKEYEYVKLICQDLSAKRFIN